MNNKLLCTFTTKKKLDTLTTIIKDSYNIIHNKIYVLYSQDQDEYICTYNVDFNNISNFLENTILVHRKKQTNTLYTLNALNLLIKQLNGGILDNFYKVDWSVYENSILLADDTELKKIKTRLHDIVYI